MDKGNPQLIKETLLRLRNIKYSLFLKNARLNFIDVVEDCRLIDALMLPLIYIWKHCCHKSISELGVEKHLMKPYERFLHDPLMFTWELYLFLKLDKPSGMSKHLRERVLFAYELLWV